MLEKNFKEKIIQIFSEGINQYFAEESACRSDISSSLISLDALKEKRHGDFSSNIAMVLAKQVKANPVILAQHISEKIKKIFNQRSDINSFIDGIEVKGAFINLWLSDKYYENILLEIFKNKEKFGQNSDFGGKRVNIEFVSANPTGPLTIAHARQAAIGDALARILKFNGYDVTTEYYLNDCGRQINMLGKSLEIRYRNLCGKEDSLPEDGYVGEYVIDIAKEIKEKHGEMFLEETEKTSNFFRKYAVESIMNLIRKDLEDFRVHFDVWTSQAEFEERKIVERTLEELEKAGYLYEQDGAKWFKSTAFGDDKDRVVRKSDGSYTYLAPDIAYHKDKYLRKFEKIIDLLGPDHHGYINRMKAAVSAMGYDKSSIDILIVQLATLLRNGVAVSMSTRRAEFISLREIIEEIGVDVARLIFLMRRRDSHLDFEFEVAKKEATDRKDCT
ncbi:arginyl-tRNA synthetase, partial [Candidatus Omnitrophus magneticus]